jgi:ABC-2 type transport system ATP-binding protein
MRMIHPNTLSHSGPAVRTTNLTKRYGDLLAVDDLTMEVPRGRIYAFLGRNGAGKTTTIRMLLGLIRPSAGTAEILGTSVAVGPRSVFARVGYLVETATAYPNLTVRENLDIQRQLIGAPSSAVGDVIRLLGLSESADRRAGRLSLGNRQRLSIARALLHRPALLILDEPANGLDPAGIIEIRNLLRRMAEDEGVTVFLSSHVLTEVAHLADRIGILHGGRLLQELDAGELKRRTRRHLDIRVNRPEQAAGVLRDRLGIGVIEWAAPDRLKLTEGLDRTAEIARVLVESGFELTALTPSEEDLESYFMRLTGGEAGC